MSSLWIGRVCKKGVFRDEHTKKLPIQRRPLALRMLVPVINMTVACCMKLQLYNELRSSPASISRDLDQQYGPPQIPWAWDEAMYMFVEYGVTHFTCPVSHPSSTGLLERGVQEMMACVANCASCCGPIRIFELRARSCIGGTHFYPYLHLHIYRVIADLLCEMPRHDRTCPRDKQRGRCHRPVTHQRQKPMVEP